MSAAPPRAEIAVIGGSGLSALFAGAEPVPATTPYGDPSDPPRVSDVGGRPVAFLPRHGTGHRLPPHRVPYRANLWALRAMGVRQVLATYAVGSLRAERGPGTLVVPDQLVDRTSGRVQTYYDEGAVHVGFAEPYCPRGRNTVLTTAVQRGWAAVDGGTMVVVEGPRFSTRAESRAHAAAGFDVVGMTGHPEAVLARELALCYTPLALVTDLDAGVASGPGVSAAEVLAEVARQATRLAELVADVAATLSSQRDCPCPHAIEAFTLPVQLP